MVEAVEQKGRPFLGICVGMQLMATTGHEYETTAGLDWVEGDVVKIDPSDASLKVPHMGWNDLVIERAHPLLDGVKSGDHTYFVHSYHFQTAKPQDRIAHVDYGQDITAIVGRDTMVGMQFHPEKSQHVGLKMIGNFLTWTP
jgi:glutamine amidotransferase